MERLIEGPSETTLPRIIQVAVRVGEAMFNAIRVCKLAKNSAAKRRLAQPTCGRNIE